MNMVHPASLTDAEAAAATDIDFRSRMALVAVTGAAAGEKIVAVARYSAGQPLNGEAEVGIVVEDAHQGQGIGAQLLERLAAYGREQGLHSLVATVASDNAGVRALIRRAGYPAEYADAGGGEYQVSVSLKGRPRLTGRTLPAGGGIFAALHRYFR
jgi:RimJ/RimL family protein N-acetyltransferase